MKAKKNKIGLILPAFIFLIGLSIAIYPLISRVYYSREAKNQVAAFEQVKKQLVDEEVEKRMDLAQAYNNTLDPTKLGDPFTDKERQGVAEYARMLEAHEKLGHVEIPKIAQDLPIYAGTSEVVLQKGVGHLEGTSLPIGGISTHSVITAHRGLPNAKLFTDLDDLELGDTFYIHNIKEVLAYRVDQILVVEPSDFEPVLVENGKDYATLLTCTPYMVNSHRLLVRGQRIDYVPAVQELEIAVNHQSKMYQVLFYITFVILIIVLVRLIYNQIKKRKKYNKEII